MAGEITSAFGSFGAWGTALKIGLWFFIGIVITVALGALAIWIASKKTETKFIELDMITRKIRMFGGRYKKTKNKAAARQMWIQKLKRYLPQFQRKDVYTHRNQDTVLLVKDNNGLSHTARLPTFKELKKWYKVVYDVDITEEKTEENDSQKLKNIYLLPNPHEDLDWLANQCAEAEKEFNIDSWWKHPNVMIIATAFICFLMIIVSLIIEKKM